MRRKTRADAAKQTAATALDATKRAANVAASSVGDSDVAGRVLEAAKTAEASVMAKAHEAAQAADRARGRRAKAKATATAETAMTEALSAREELEAKLISHAQDAAKAATKAAEKTAKSPTGRGARRATKSALKDAKRAAKSQKKARGHHFGRLFVLLGAAGAAAVAGSEDLREKLKAATGSGEKFDFQPPTPAPPVAATPHNGSTSAAEKAKA